MDAQTRSLIARHLKVGNTAEAQGLVADVLRQDPNDEEAWLSLAGLVDDEAQKRECLARVLSINPKNKSARRLLDQLSAGPMPADRPLDEVGQPSPPSRPRLRRTGPRARRRARRPPVPRWMWATLIGAAAVALLVCCIGGFWLTGVFNAFFPPTPIPDTATSTFPTPLPSFTPTPVTPTATLFRLPTATPIPSSTAPPLLRAALWGGR